MTVPAVHIDVWSDYVCPFCYLTEPTLARIEQEFGNAISITWRAFELRPEPVSTLPPDGEYSTISGPAPFNRWRASAR